MRIIAGLGNPGLDYQKTRHNAGFWALDAVAEALHIRVTRRGFSGLYGEGVRNGGKILLVKPQTYMNRSGDCLQRLLRFYKARPEDVLLLYDDIELPAGSLRIRERGGPGTHNGMRSVIACVGSEELPRIRIGVGDQRRGELKDYVLEKPSKEEQARIDEACRNAADAAVMWLDGRLAEAQGRYNRKHEGGKL
ncbi:MAG: aminoacyl-tRNA hydrolase [Clostridia bacterium]|nr:aminoacyl-tRNA hydrolase [Clostridia bacterium]